jgi:hypothetical protein
MDKSKVFIPAVFLSSIVGLYLCLNIMELNTWVQLSVANVYLFTPFIQIFLFYRK